MIATRSAADATASTVARQFLAQGRLGRRLRGRRLRLGLVAVSAALGVAAWQHRTMPLHVLGSALVVEDRVRPADVAVVSVAMPHAAALDAAKLYRRGLVREVWISQWREEPVERRVEALGVRPPRQHEVARTILEQDGVPSSAIVVLDDPVAGLDGEMAAVGRALRARPRLRLIVLTARTHTARARLLLGEYARAGRAWVRAPHADDFDQTGWWRSRSATREVLLEGLKWIDLFARSLVTASAREVRR